MFKNEMFKKISLFSIGVISLVACFIKYKNIKKRYEEQLLFKQRHNCVVMYTANLGMSGWPPHKGRVLPIVTQENCLDILYEPILYFINTATKSLDIAYMLIGVQKVFDAITNAHKRGVKIRMIFNYDHFKKDLTAVRRMIREGMEVQFYISRKPSMESIMHYKYMLKDYDENKGYTLIGSMNLTRTAFLENYEDIVISSDLSLAKSIFLNFNDCWRDLKTENSTLFNITTLLDANLIEIKS